MYYCFVHASKLYIYMTDLSTIYFVIAHVWNIVIACMHVQLSLFFVFYLVLVSQSQRMKRFLYHVYFSILNPYSKSSIKNEALKRFRSFYHNPSMMNYDTQLCYECSSHIFFQLILSCYIIIIDTLIIS